ncbi:hypothetical protein CVT26_013185 [Gymnopilus dilepis]|uniref:Uncharacterized protein n=1 Tax=Gymnopilus dilepis TaxID=231916 RepID=A0A409VWE3_9AGAR|nr:hypothetical protein CVT26_013185 [Gymnopilus dilepis]
MPWVIRNSNLFKSHIRCDTAQRESCLSCTKLQAEERRLLEAAAALERQLEKCREARELVNRSHDKITSRLPQELVSRIFEFCFPPSEPLPLTLAVFPHDFGRCVAARLLLGAICHEWRRIAWSTPQLWTELAVSLRNINITDYHWHREFVHDWLRRSGGLPLSLSITFEDSHFISDVETEKVVNEFNSVSDRWHVLEINQARLGHVGLFKAHPCCKPILQTLAINRIDHNTDSTDIDNFSPFQTEIVPQRLSLNGLPFTSINMPWEQLTSLQLSGRSTLECLEVLTRAPNLRELAVSLISIDWDRTPVMSRTIEHHKLRDLYIDMANDDGLDVLFGAAVFPGLVHLTVTGCVVVDSLVAFLGRCSCQLDCISIIDTPMFGDSDIITILEATPSITKLELHPESPADSLPDVLFHRLAETAIQSSSATSDNPFLPNLRHLAYHAEHMLNPWLRCNKKDMDWTSIASVFGPLSELETPHRRPLQTLEMQFIRGDYLHPATAEYEFMRRPFSLSEEHISAFLDILKAGLNLNLTYVEDQSDVITTAQGHLDKSRA